jgi:uncharacterized protein
MLADVHIAELTPPEQRVLGCLIEKRWTTPDQYPLSLNALRLACNQSTNRDPVTDYDESTVREAAQRLCKYGLARLVSGHASRTVKYRHLAEEGLGLERDELAILGVLLLRGPQTPGELKGRSERMAPLASLAEVERVLGVLAEREYAVRMQRRPGQKEDRFQQLLGGAAYPPAADAPALVTTVPVHSAPSQTRAVTTVAPVAADLAARVSALEGKVASLRAELSALRRPQPPSDAVVPPIPPIDFRDAEVDSGPGGVLAQAMRDEIAVIYDGLELDADHMPAAGPAELRPPHGAFLVGWQAEQPVCCGGIKRFDDRTCEIKKMYVVPERRGQGVARRLLHALESQARRLGYEFARLDTGPKQVSARGLYESERYAEIEDFNGNPVASFWGEKAL